MACHDLPIIILAAGASSRMRGRDKLLEMIDRTPLLRLQAKRALSVTDGPVIVALPPIPHPRYRALDGLNIVPLEIPDAEEGMNASLRTAFAALPAGTSRAMLLLGDLPDLTAADLTTVADAMAARPDSLVWRGVTEDGAPGHPIIFDAALFPEFATLRGDGGGREVVAAAGGRVSLVPLAGGRARRDLDTPEDWAAWRAARKPG